jgi:hypothetical protein
MVHVGRETERREPRFLAALGMTDYPGPARESGYRVKNQRWRHRVTN